MYFVFVFNSIMVVYRWFLTLNTANMFDHFWMFAFIVFVVLHICYKPVVHFFFCNLTIMISITLLNSSINILLWNESTISVQGSSRCLLMNGKSHPDEAS